MVKSLEQLLNEYDTFHSKTERTPDYGLPVNERALHGAIGLNGESGEILELYKKRMYGKQVNMSRNDLIKEAGDLFYYYWLLLDAEEISLREVIEANIEKLSKRYNVSI